MATLSALVLAILSISGGPRVVATTPSTGDEDVPINLSLRLLFSRPMDQASVETHLTIEPEVPGRFAWDGREMEYLPLGALAPETVYTVSIGSEASDARGRKLGKDYVWRFATRAPQLLYLARPRPDQDVRQLFAVTLAGTAADEPSTRQLTQQEWGVWDYEVHPLGEEIVYSALRADGGTDLWRMDRDGGKQRRLLACPQAACLGPAWSPDGRWLAYERREIGTDAPNLDPKAGRIWLLDLDKGQERPLFDYDVPLHSPTWSPDSQKLAYISPALPGLEVYDLETEELLQYGNQWGAAPVWSPGGSRLVMPELLFVAEEMAVRLLVIDLADEHLLDISGGQDTDELHVRDEGPAWSPGGGWIAFGRRFLDDERWTPGRQIWLVRPDGSEAYPLIEEPMADHFALAWRPDGAVLAYARADLSEGPQPVPDVSVWMFDLVRRERQSVAGQGVLPLWLP